MAPLEAPPLQAARPPRGFDPLQYLSGLFDAIELNTTFYALASPDRAEAWLHDVLSAFPGLPLVVEVRHVSWNSPDVYVITNNHFRGKGVANALMLQAELSGRPVRAPDTLVETYPEALVGLALPVPAAAPSA
jgi:uncharacterized protein YecE (DUF72 family)